MIEVTDQNFNEIVSKGNVVVIFSGSHCSFCRMQQSELLRNNTERNQPDIVFAKYSTDNQKEVASKLKVMGVPQTFFYKDGIMLEKLIGFAGMQSFDSAILRNFGR